LKKRTKKLLDLGVIRLDGPVARDRGAALLVALWAMMAMATLVAGIRVLGLRDSTLAQTRLEQAQLTAAADAMINLTILRLLDLGTQGHPPTDGTATNVSFAGQTGQVAVQDESGRIDLNQAPGPLLTAFLQSQGIDFDQAQRLSDKIQDWREPGAGRRLNGAKSEDYRRAGYPYGPRGGRMESVDELRLIMGMTPALFDALAPALTVVSQNAWPDPAVAPPIVLRALPGMDEDRIANMESARQARRVTAADGTVTDTEPTPTLGRAFAIGAHIAGRTASVQRHALIRLTGIPAAPVVIYAWQ
jgi:general secretion pathway protein K